MKIYIEAMKLRILYQISLASLVLALGACSFFSDKDSDKEEKKSSSNSSSETSSSSSEESDRLEIEYSDTIALGDTLSYKVLDSLVDSIPWNFYLGEFPRGSVLHLGFKNLRLEEGTIVRVVSEKGVVQLPTNALPDGSYQDYASIGDSTFVVNHFVTMDTGYYYLEVEATPSATSSSAKADFQAHFTVDSAYFQFVGLEDSVELPANEEFQGCFRIDEIEDSARFYFGANTGKNISLITSGQSLDGISLREVEGALLDSAESSIRVQMLPQDSTRWSLLVRSKIPSYYAGNYAFLTLNLGSIQLGKGEYFAAPDTMPTAGDTLTIHRKGSENSGWDVRHDHYIYLGSLNAGDTAILWYGSDGIERISKMLRVLDSKGAPVDTLPLIHSTNWVKQQGNRFVSAKAGAYYLHFSGIGSDDTYWKDEDYTLHQRTMIQKLHSLTTFNYNPPTIEFDLGDTIKLDELLEFGSITPTKASKNFLPLVSRTERNVLRDSIDIAFSGSASGDEVRSSWLLANEAGTAHLLLQSTADPAQIDTCVIQVVEP